MITDYLKKREQMSSDRSQVQSQRIGVNAYAEPYRKIDLEGAATLVIPEQRKLVDITLQKSLRVNANGQMELIFPRSEQWVVFDPPSASSEDEDAIQACRHAAEQVSRFIRNSNFFTATQSMLFDRSAYGDGAIWMQFDRDERKLKYMHIPCGTYYAERDRYGKLIYFMFDEKMSPLAIVREFASKTPEAVRKRAEKGDNYPQAISTLIEPLDRGTAEYRAGRRWKMTTFLVENGAVLREQNFTYCPVICPEFEPIPGSSYGTGLGIMAVGDQIAIINTLKTQSLIMRQTAEPPFIAPIGSMGDGSRFDVSPGGLSLYNPYRGNAKPEPLFIPSGRQDHAEYMLDKNERNIREICDFELFNPISGNIGRPEDMKATVANMLETYAAKAASPAYYRLIEDYQIPVLDIAINILKEEGVISLPEGFRMTIVTPFQIFLNQRGLQTLGLAIATMEPIFTIDPEATLAFKTDYIIYDTARKLNLPEGYTRTPSETERLKEKRRKENNALAQQELAIEGSTARSQINLNNARANAARTQ